MDPFQTALFLFCGRKRDRIKAMYWEIHLSLQMEPAKFWIREDIYYTYACKNCEQETDEANILKTPKEPVLSPGSFMFASAVAHLTLQRGFSCRICGNSPSDTKIRDVFSLVPSGTGV
jgi:hypothetical protein